MLETVTRFAAENPLGSQAGYPILNPGAPCMGRRKYPRVKMTLPAKAWLESQHFPLGRDCFTVNITPDGVCLNGLAGVKPGEVITLAYHHKKCRFRVVWVGAPGSPQSGLVGLKNLEPDKRIFGVDFSRPESDDFEVPEEPSPDPPAKTGELRERRTQERRQGEERRAYPRYVCSGTVEVSQEGVDVRTWGRITDIALGGCYVEMLSPFPLETPLELSLHLAEIQVKVNGRVKVVHPGFGMGIQFTKISDADRNRLTLLVNWLAGGAKGTPEQPQPEPQPPPAAVPSSEAGEPDAGAALEALVRWFNQRNVLTRQEFLELLEESRKHPQPEIAAAVSSRL